MLGVEVAGAFGECRELLPGFPKLSEMLVKIRKMPFEELDDVMAGPLAFLT